jgi:hypothetical protein
MKNKIYWTTQTWLPTELNWLANVLTCVETDYTYFLPESLPHYPLKHDSVLMHIEATILCHICSVLSFIIWMFHNWLCSLSKILVSKCGMKVVFQLLLHSGGIISIVSPTCKDMCNLHQHYQEHVLFDCVLCQAVMQNLLTGLLWSKEYLDGLLNGHYMKLN